MPLFEFICRTCGRAFEALVTGTRAAECPACRSTDLEKQVSSFGAARGRGEFGAVAASPFT